MALSGMLADVAGGGYVSVVKVIPVLIVLLVWARLLTWVDKDAPALQLPREPLNIGLLSGLIVGFLLFLLLPNFFIALGVLLVCFGAEAGLYLHIRSRKSEFEDVKNQFREWIKSLGKKKLEAKPEVEEGKIAVISSKGTPIPPPEAKTPERAIYDSMQSALAEPLQKAAEQVELAPEDDGVTTKYVVDGVVYRGAVLDSVAGASLISYLKFLAGLVIEELRKPQSGSFKVVLDGKRHDIKAQTAGTRAGEHIRLTIDPKKRSDVTLANMGFTERQLGIVKELIADKKGIILVSAPKGQGLTSTFYALLRGHDVFLEHVQTMERDSDGGIEGATQNPLAPTAPPDEEAKKIEWIISQEPDVLGVVPLEGQESAVRLAKFAKSGKRVYVGMRASSTFEALDIWRKLVGDDRLALEPLRLVINSRILRKLCQACKVGYSPDAPTLRKLGINPERVTALYQARTTPLVDPKGKPIPCEFCRDLRFKGRVGVFETLMIDDKLREVLAAGQSPSQEFRKQRGKYLQEEALSLVEKGDTAVQEVLRVLKAAPAPAVAGARTAARAPAQKG
jgi:type II secretory ATPase GspE/PulE/Tfp pilus assembly ATPase PilB-like protein